MIEPNNIYLIEYDYECEQHSIEILFASTDLEKAKETLNIIVKEENERLEKGYPFDTNNIDIVEIKNSEYPNTKKVLYRAFWKPKWEYPYNTIYGGIIDNVNGGKI